MLKKLTAKVQKICPSLPPSATGFSNALVIEPDDTLLLEKRGTVYVVFDISGSEEFDTTLVTKVVTDILHDSYFQSENISPIQSLERAISEVRDRVTKLTNETIRIHEVTVEFNLLAGVIWGNVLYVVCYGDASGFLMRDGEIKPINANAEGNFAAASGVVKDDDVIILSTKNFVEKVTPAQLLNGNVPTDNLPLGASSLILKMIVDTRFSEYEVVDFGLKGQVKTERQPFSKFKFISNLFAKKTRQPQKPEIDKMKDPGLKPGVSSFLFGKGLSSPGLKARGLPASEIDRIDIRLKKIPDQKQKITSLIALAGLLFVISLAFTAFKNRKPSVAPPAQDEVSVLSKADEKPVETAPETPIDPAKDAQYKISRVTPEAFYDLKLTDAAANPSLIEVTKEALLLTDPNSKKIYTSDLVTPKFTESSQTYVDKGISATYVGNTYTLGDDTITKKTSTGEASTWAQNSVLTGGRSMAIDMNVYVLKSDGSLLKFLQGTQQTFEITGLDIPLLAPVQVLADYDFENIYIADAGNKRVVIINKKGELVKQLLSNGSQNWNDIRSIAITADENKLYVLDGTVVYSVEL